MDVPMAEPIQIMDEEPVFEGIPELQNPILYVEIEAKRNVEIQLEMLETMKSLKSNLDTLKVDNVKLMTAKSDQE